MYSKIGDYTVDVINKYKDLISLIVSLCTFGVVLWGVLLARSTLKSHYEIAEKKQTADFLFQSREDEKYINALNTIRKMHKEGTSLHCLIEPPENREEEMRQNYIEVRYILNFYERMAIAIKNGMYNEGMLKETSYSTLCLVYRRTKPLIEKVRENHNQPTAYIEFERLAERWIKNPLTLKT